MAAIPRQRHAARHHPRLPGAGRRLRRAQHRGSPLPSVEAAIRGLKAGEVDLLTRVTGYERREPGLAYSRPYLDDTPIIVGRRDDPCLPPDLADKRVLVLAQYLDPEQVRNAYPAAHLETVRSTAEGFDQVLSGEADAFIGDKLRVDHHMRARPGAALQNKFAANLSSGGFSFASRADDTRLLTLVDYVLGTLDEHQREIILAHWTAAPRLFSPTGAFALDSAQERWLDQQPRLRLILAEAPPYFFRDARGKWSGLGLELLKQLGDTYQLKLELLDSEGAARDRQRLARARPTWPAPSMAAPAPACSTPSPSAPAAGPSWSARTPAPPAPWRP